MSPLILAACLLFGLPAGECRAESQMQDLTAWSIAVHAEQSALAPNWATAAWQMEYAAHIVAGEAPPHCETCNLWVACTLRRDVERGLSPWGLYGKNARWHGWGKHVTPAHQAAVSAAMREGGCDDVPRCRYLGNIRDFQYNWTAVGEGTAFVTGNEYGLIVCVPEGD